MEELKKLLGMELSDEAKELLVKVETSFNQVSDANKNFMEAIEAKDKVISEQGDDRKSLRAKIAELEKGGSGSNKDNGEQVEKLNREWQEKYGHLEESYTGLKNKVAESDRLSAFNSLNIVSQFPKDWDESQIDFAVKAIQREVFDGSVYDHENKMWGYGEVGKFDFNKDEGKPYSIESRTKEMMSKGAFDMFFAGSQGSGGGSNPKAGNGNAEQKTMQRSQFENMGAGQQADFMKNGGALID